jgi:hypothetical protein
VPYKSSIGLHDILTKDYERLCGASCGEKPVITKNQEESLKIDNGHKRIHTLRALIALDIERVKNGQDPRVFTMREIFPARAIMLSRSGKHDTKNLRDDYIARLENLAGFVSRLGSEAV